MRLLALIAYYWTDDHNWPLVFVRLLSQGLLALRYGQIVIVSEMVDPNGVNPKDRPTVVVTPTDEIVPGEPIIVVAISTLLPGGAPDDHVELPWDPRGHPRTGLRTRCAAVIPWIQRVAAERIIRSIGFVPGKHLEVIATRLADLRDLGAAAEPRVDQPIDREEGSDPSSPLEGST